MAGFRSLGYHAYGYEKLKAPETMDLCSPVGFAFALQLAMMTHRGGFVHFAPVCSTWVWMSRHSVSRSYFQPMGRVSHHNVSEANKMISRVVLLCTVLMARGCWWVIEQPVSSLMQCPGIRS